MTGNSMGTITWSTNILHQPWSISKPLWIDANGKLVEIQPAGRTDPSIQDQKMYITPDGRATLNAGEWRAMKADQVMQIQNEITNLTDQYQALIDAHKATAHRNPLTKAAKQKFMEEHVFRWIFNTQPPTIPEASNIKDWLPFAIVQKHLGQTATTQIQSQEIKHVSSQVTWWTTTALISNQPSAIPAATRNGDTIAALMAQLNGTTISDTTAQPTIAGRKSMSRIKRRSKAGFALEAPLISLSKVLTNQTLKSIVSLNNSINISQNNPVQAIAAIYGHRSIRTHGVLSWWWYIKAKLRSRAFRLGLMRKPDKVAKSMADAIAFYTSILSQVTVENGFDQATITFKEQFLSRLQSITDTYMTKWAASYLNQMSSNIPWSSIYQAQPTLQT